MECMVRVSDEKREGRELGICYVQILKTENEGG